MAFVRVTGSSSRTKSRASNKGVHTERQALGEESKRDELIPCCLCFLGEDAGRVLIKRLRERLLVLLQTSLFYFIFCLSCLFVYYYYFFFNFFFVCRDVPLFIDGRDTIVYSGCICICICICVRTKIDIGLCAQYISHEIDSILN